MDAFARDRMPEGLPRCSNLKTGHPGCPSGNPGCNYRVGIGKRPINLADCVEIYEAVASLFSTQTALPICKLDAKEIVRPKSLRGTVFIDR